MSFSEAPIIFFLVSKDDHSKEDCIAFFVLTHGNDKREISAKDVYYSLDKLWQHFTADNCTTLAGKPKLFFINACRGKKKDRGVSLFHRRGRIETDGAKARDGYKVPRFADFLIAQSTVEGESYHIIDNVQVQVGTH